MKIESLNGSSVNNVLSRETISWNRDARTISIAKASLSIYIYSEKGTDPVK